MGFYTALLPFLFAARSVHSQTTCTTLQPVFQLPLDATSTVFDTTITSTSSVDCSACSLVVSTFRAVVNTSLPASFTATTTQALTTSETFVCSPSPSTTSTPTGLPTIPLPSPTASPLPSINSTAQTFIDELSTAFLYAALLSNGGNEAKLCSTINPSSLSEITNPSINGSTVQSQVCALAAIDLASPSIESIVVGLNQRGVSYLATALFAVQVAGGYAGGPNLNTLCSEVEATLIDNLFVNYTPDVGTAVKDYVCSAAAAAASASASATGTTPSQGTVAPTSNPTPAPYPANTTTTSASSFSTPTGFANTVVPAPLLLATSEFRVSPSFTAQHTLFVLTDSNTALSEATIASFCLDQCIAYQPNSTTGPCLSINVNVGNPIPPTPPGPPQWFCSGYDAYLASDGSDYVALDTPGSYMHGLGVNRVCDGSYRAYWDARSRDESLLEKGGNTSKNTILDVLAVGK